MDKFNKGIEYSRLRHEFNKEAKSLALVNKTGYIKFLEQKVVKNLALSGVVKSFYCFEESINMELKCDIECSYCKSIKIAQ